MLEYYFFSQYSKHVTDEKGSGFKNIHISSVGYDVLQDENGKAIFTEEYLKNPTNFSNASARPLGVTVEEVNGVKTYFNGKLIEMNSIKDYVNLYFKLPFSKETEKKKRAKKKDENEIVIEESEDEKENIEDSEVIEELKEYMMFKTDDCRVFICPNTEFAQVSFVNGINTFNGGVHV
jgi:hypothetical protein